MPSASDAEVGRAARGFEFAGAMQRFGKRNEVNGLLAFAEGDHLIENAAMLFEEKVFGLEVFDSGV
jgi:hypothetical protein